MTLVVSDTTPLNYLILIGAQNVLPGLYGSIVVPSQVVEELQRKKAPEPVRTWANALPTWAKVKVGDASHFPTLNYGESAALAIALEIQADAMLVDDLDARLVAETVGIVTVGTIGVLAAAHNASLLDFDSAVQALRGTTFRIHGEIISTVRSTLVLPASD